VLHGLCNDLHGPSVQNLRGITDATSLFQVGFKSHGMLGAMGLLALSFWAS